MQFPTKYRCLNQNEFVVGDHKIVPIRYEDRLDIMKWRNEQIYHLRQAEPLTEESQEKYFKEILANLFEQEKPKQILFSFIKNDKCFGYGGLVHINWLDKNAEISFIMNTNLEEKYFHYHWSVFLKLIEKVANNLQFFKVFTFAYDIRPNLYNVLLKNKYFEDARLHKHVFFGSKGYKDVVIHSKILQ